MIANAILIIVLGLFCLIGSIVGVIFTIIAFANNKPGKYAWLTGFLISLIGLVFCILIFIRKAVHKVEHFASNLNEQMTESLKNYSDSISYSNTTSRESNEHIKTLKRYSEADPTIPAQFYNFLGFQNYYRFPLRYPYAIHCDNFKDNGELFNESKVSRFDENENGEIPTTINKIDRLAFDKNYLLVDQKLTSTRSANVIHHYVLFSFETGKTEEAKTEKELVELAEQKGYKGSEKLISIEEYGNLFN